MFILQHCELHRTHIQRFVVLLILTLYWSDLLVLIAIYISVLQSSGSKKGRVGILHNVKVTNIYEPSLLIRVVMAVANSVRYEKLHINLDFVLNFLRW